MNSKARRAGTPMNLWAFLMSEQNEDWCVGLSGLFISCATKTEAFDLGRGCDSPSGLKSKKERKKVSRTNGTSLT
jgi:hypothetical protein